jgi:biotin carboxylase
MNKRFMVLGGSPANEQTLRAMAAVPGIELVVLDKDPDSVARGIAHAFEAVDIKDAKAVLNAAEQHGARGIYAMNDHAMRAAAYTADKLGLPGINPETVHATLDKGAMREAWKASGVIQPTYAVCTSKDEIAHFARTTGYPIVLKPTDCGGGGRGVTIVRDSEGLDAGFQFASRFLTYSDRIIAEAYIEGTECTVEVVRHGGRLRVIAIGDKYKPNLLSRVATKIAYPGQFTPGVTARIRDACDRALLALGIEEGIGHMECIVKEDGSVWMLEMGARAGGGHTFCPIASHVAGFNYPEWVMQFWMGDGGAVPTLESRGAAYYFLYSESPGPIEEIRGIDACRDAPRIVEASMWRKPGDTVSCLENSLDRLGCVVALADNRDEAVEAAEAAIQKIKIVVR